jgi:nucleoside-diphosphate-sugar epimerase
VAVERDLLELADDDFSPVFLRNATAYGFSPRLRCDIVVNDLVGRALLDGRVTVLSDGTPWRPLAHVDDIAGVIRAVLDAPREAVHGEAFNVGRAEDNHQVRDIARCVADVVGGVDVDVTGELGGDPRSYRVDFAKLGRHLPAFVPAWELERGVRQLVDAYREHGLDAQGFASTFRRLPRLQALQGTGRLDAALRWVEAA